jgi:hypothetical protein
MVEACDMQVDSSAGCLRCIAHHKVKQSLREAVPLVGLRGRGDARGVQLHGQGGCSALSPAQQGGCCICGCGGGSSSSSSSSSSQAGGDLPLPLPG